MNILAIDMATKTGWAHSCGVSGVWDFRIGSDESSGMRLVRFAGKIREVISNAGVDVIAYEVPSVARGVKANLRGLKLGAKMQAVIEQLVEESEGIECVGYNIQTIKQHALGDKKKGSKRNKEAMVAAAKENWPDEEILDDNHADALWILDLAKKSLCVT